MVVYVNECVWLADISSCLWLNINMLSITGRSGECALPLCCILIPHRERRETVNVAASPHRLPVSSVSIHLEGTRQGPWSIRHHLCACATFTQSKAVGFSPPTQFTGITVIIGVSNHARSWKQFLHCESLKCCTWSKSSIGNQKMNCINIVMNKIRPNICIQTYEQHHSTVLDMKGFFSSHFQACWARPSCGLFVGLTRQDRSDITSAIMTYSLLSFFRYYRVFSITNYLHAWCICLFFPSFLPFPLFHLLSPAGHQQEGPSPPPTWDESCWRFIPGKSKVSLATVACKECRNGLYCDCVRWVWSGPVMDLNMLFSCFNKDLSLVSKPGCGCNKATCLSCVNVILHTKSRKINHSAPASCH